MPEATRHSLHEHAQAWDVLAATYHPHSTRVTPLGDYLSPDAHSVRFSEMSAEAEAEMAAWDEMLHGRH